MAAEKPTQDVEQAVRTSSSSIRQNMLNKVRTVPRYRQRWLGSGFWGEGEGFDLEARSEDCAALCWDLSVVLFGPVEYWYFLL